MNEGLDRAERTEYGTLGLDVGVVGRWSRLIWGLLILVPISIALYRDYVTSGISTRFVLNTVLYLFVITLAYTSAYWILGERLFARANPWLNTAILVGPAFVLAWWGILIEPLTGIHLPSGLQLATLLYVGISFLLQWRLEYGGCEVVAVPILLFKRRYTTYCIPLVAADAVEKAVVDRLANRVSLT